MTRTDLSFSLTLLAALATGLLASPASAGVITWSPAMDTGSPSDILTEGTTVEAFNATNTNTGSVTVNGVTFQNTATLLPGNVAPQFLAGNFTSDAGLDALLNSLDFGGGGGVVSLNVGGGGLVAGQKYAIQVFFTDLRSCCSNRTMRFGDGDGGGIGNFVDLDATGAGFGQYAIGEFMATSQTLTLDAQGFGNAHITAYQIRQLPEPASIAMIGLAGGAMLLRRRRAA